MICSIHIPQIPVNDNILECRADFVILHSVLAMIRSCNVPHFKHVNDIIYPCLLLPLWFCCRSSYGDH